MMGQTSPGQMDDVIYYGVGWPTTLSEVRGAPSAALRCTALCRSCVCACVGVFVRACARVCVFQGAHHGHGPWHTAPLSTACVCVHVHVHAAAACGVRAPHPCRCTTRTARTWPRSTT